MKKTLLILRGTCAIVFLSAFLSCSKTVTTPPVTYGNVYLQIQNNLGSGLLDTGIVLADPSGRNYKFSSARYYIGGITLKGENGTNVSLGSTTYFLENVGSSAFLAGSVPSGNYISITFSIGIDPVTNQTNPSTYTAGTALAPQNPAMWFGSTTKGYMYLNVQGLVDTTGTGNGTPTVPFTIQLGQSQNVRTTSINLNSNPSDYFYIYGSQNNTINLIADYNAILKNIKYSALSGSCTITPFNANAGLESTIAGNISSMFSLQ